MSPRRSNPTTALGAVLRAERDKQERSQEALAHDAGTTAHTIGRIERGLADPSFSTVIAILDALGLSLEDLAQRLRTHKKS